MAITSPPTKCVSGTPVDAWTIVFRTMGFVFRVPGHVPRACVSAGTDETHLVGDIVENGFVCESVCVSVSTLMDRRPFP
jgi:hypothetical protein